MSSQQALARPRSVSADGLGQPLELREFQSVLHRLLEGFLNDYFLSRASRLLAPWMVSYDQREVPVLVRGVKLRTGSDPPSDGEADALRPKEMARVISSGYRVLRSVLGGAGETRERVVRAVQKFEPARYAPLPAFSELVTLQRDIRALADDLRAAYLFGSSADLEIAPGFSDVDCFIVLRRETAEEPERLLALRQQLLRCLVRCYRVDPLQHHGFFLATETDLASFPEAFLPLLLIERGTALLKNEPLSFHLRDDRQEARQSLTRDLKFLQIFGRDGKPRSLFFMKLLVSSVLVLPPLVLHALGQPVYKRESFEPARPLFSSEAWKAVETASRLRTIWPQTVLPHTLVRVLSVWPNPHALSLAARVRRLTAPCREALEGGFLDSVTHLVDEAWVYACHDNA